ARQGLINEKIITVADLVARDELPPHDPGANFGRKSRKAVLAWMERHSLHFGMEISAEPVAEPPAPPAVEPAAATPAAEVDPTRAEKRKVMVGDFSEIFSGSKHQSDMYKRHLLRNAGLRILNAALDTFLADIIEADVVVLYKAILSSYESVEGWEPPRELGRLAHRLWGMAERNVATQQD
ncbi:MAG: hypothetical protein Q7S26_02405, partial [bacterium]|nr:hypothetical protein [bacterium]